MLRLYLFKHVLMEAPMWSCHLLVFLLFGCLEATYPASHPANRMYALVRSCVMHFSAFDPCSRGGFWFTMSMGRQAMANDDCEEAYDAFIVLTDAERASCLNAQEPECRAGFGCSNLDYNCTFMCKTEVEEWERQEGRLVRVTRTVLQAKRLRTIAATVVEPRGIPEDLNPEVYSRGPARRYRRTYALP